MYSKENMVQSTSEKCISLSRDVVLISNLLRDVSIKRGFR